MPMFDSFANLWRDRRGVSAIEFALFLPIFLMLLAGMIDFGRLLYQADAIDKGLRAGALFAAHSDKPLTAAAETTARNLVRTGNLDGTPPYLVSGWAIVGADLQIATTTAVVSGQTITVYRLSATVPFDPLLPGLMSVLGMSGNAIRLYHEQAHIGT